MNKKLLLMDGNNVMFRAYYATAAMGNLMRNKNGLATNMIYGFINIYNKVISDSYTHVAVAFDKGSKTRRHKLYKDYKAGRAETPIELIDQIPYLHKFLECMNVKYFMSDDFEADDIISSLNKKFKNEVDEIDVLSNDNDLFQLIGPNSIQLYQKLKETVKYDKDMLLTEKGITPSQIPDYKALIGDKSDNLLGVEGIGPVTAAKLLQEYKTLDGIYANIESITGKTKERLIKDKDQAYFTKDMATLDPSFELDYTLDDFKVIEPNIDELIKFYTDLDFNSFLKKLPKKTIQADFNYQIISDESKLDNIFKENETNYLVLELLGENYHIASPIGFGLSNSNGNFYIPYDVALSNINFTFALSDNSIKKSVYDYKKMYVVLLKENIILNGVIFDSLIASYLINPDLTKDDFKVISNHFGYNDISSDEEIYGKGAKFNLPSLEFYAPHIARKAFALSIVEPFELKEIESNSQSTLLNEIEIPFSRVLGDMETLGLRVDTTALLEYENNLLSELESLEKEIYSLAKHEFNILSPKQLATVLFDELGLKSTKKTKTGYSTDSDVLNDLRLFHPIIDLILRYRMLSKLEGTYVIGVKNAISEKRDNHIHTIYKQALTDTGRLSSTEPNLQNLPIRNKEASEFRKIFIGEDNSYLMSSDYSQIELRVLAHMSADPNLTKAFINHEDIHEATAKAIFRKNEVSKEERRSAKAINFGIVYGISSWGLSNDIGISPRQAEDFINKYHESFPNILPYTKSLIDYATNNGYVKTLFNRRRYIRDINSPNYNLREFSKRTAMNAPIQGTAADILKYAMVKLDRALKLNSLHSRLVLTIHDEVVLNVPFDEIDKTIEITEKVLTTIVPLDVPLEVETSYGINLFEAK